MNKVIAAIVVVLFLGISCIGKVREQPVSRFRADLSALIRVANKPSGFDSLKYIELSRGVWNCKLELQGFIPTVEEQLYHPASRLMVSAVSVSPSAQQNIKMLLLKGLPGYTMKDSDTDKTVDIDRTKQSRKVVFTKTERSVTSTVSVIFNAHQYSSITLEIEAW
jgi:hypothetical protein